MSRIILAAREDGLHHIVVGWDPPQNTFYFQEFKAEPFAYQREDGRWGIKIDKTVVKKTWSSRDEAEGAKWNYVSEGWDEIGRYNGYTMNEFPRLEEFVASLPEDIKPFVNERVILQLGLDRLAQDSRSINDFSSDDDMKLVLSNYKEPS